MSESLSRVFVAVKFPENVVDELVRLQGVLQNWNFTGKVTERENLHITLKFIGEVSDELVSKYQKALSKIKFDAGEISLGDVGFFSYRGRPRIVFVKLKGKALYDLQKKVSDVLSAEGFTSEGEFAGHVSIGRVKFVSNSSGLKNYILGMKASSSSFNLESFDFLKSKLDAVGPEYELIEEVKVSK